MGERHTIVVFVERGEVTDVEFCPCCPGVTVEIQTYAEPDSLRDGDDDHGAVSTDDRGSYRTKYYESDG